tara:strand:+ start:28882 stop:29223 length:342 start_codon:yes stop_codon:yes gene_type:complete
MPKIVTITANPDFDKPRDQEFLAIKKAGPKKVSYQTAMENIRLSEGRYSIMPERDEKPKRINVELSDMSPQDLKVMLVSLGIKTEKKMKRSDVLTLIRKRLDDVEIEEDDAEE